MAKTAGQLPTPTGKRPSRSSQRLDDTRQTKKQIAHGRREARQNRIIWLSVAAVALAILGILIAAVINEAVIKPKRAVATVNGAKIAQDDYQALVTYYRSNLETTINNLQSQLQGLDASDEDNAFIIQFYQQQVSQLESQLANVEQSALVELIDDALIQEKAREEGLSVTADEVQSTINEELQQLVSANSQTTVTDTQAVLTPTLVPEDELKSTYQSVLSQMNVSDKELRTIMRRSLLRNKVQELLASQVLTTGLVIHAQVIQADAEDKAAAAQARVEKGEDFGTVAKEVSTASDVSENGGDIGWVTTGQLASLYGQEVETLAFSLEPGTVGTASSGGKFYVVRIAERNENGPLPTEELDQRKASALTDWLAERKASPDVSIVRLTDSASIPTSEPTEQSTP